MPARLGLYHLFIPHLLLRQQVGGLGVGVACLKFSHNRAVFLGLLLVEFEGLAEILQALEARHCLQLTVIHLQAGCAWGWAETNN